MNQDFSNFNLGLDGYLKPKRQKTEETRFAQLNDDLVEGAQAKSTKYATNYAVSVFKGNFSVKILL